MGKIDKIPLGMTEITRAQSDEVMPAPCPNTGWRKATVAMRASEIFAEAGAQTDVPKQRAMLAVKRVGVHIGLKPSDLMLLDTLAAFSQPQDWEHGQRAIVWPSNALLMDQTGFSLSALKRHIKRLANTGVIAFHDSPNGKRWGYRDASGAIVEGYGFDLSPLAARAEEFEQLHVQIQQDRAEYQRLKRHITITRRMIRAKLDAAIEDIVGGPWGDLTEMFEELLARLPDGKTTTEKLRQLAEQFEGLKTRIERAFHPQQDTVILEEMDPKTSKNEPHLQTTNKLESVKSMDRGFIENAEPSPAKGNETGKIDLATVAQACPDFMSWAKNLGIYLKDWPDLHRIAGQLAPMIGIPQTSWDAAQEQMGHHKAAIAVALVFEKHTAGEVRSPSGYLRGMITKSRAGELHLDRSCYGRLKASAA